MPHVTIMETGLVSPKNRELHGSYPQMFENLIGAADANVTFNTVSIPAGEPLPDVGRLEAILITGSAAGVYDAFDWIAPLEDFVRTAHDNKVPMVGVCFGHQLIAQALGGTVRKSEKGWGIGRHVYDVAPGNAVIEGARIALACSHQDQVIAPPAGARTILSSDFTPHAGLLYGDTTLSVQPHRNSPSATRWPAARWCTARAMRPTVWWQPPKPRSPNRWRAPGWAARSRAFLLAEPSHADTLRRYAGQARHKNRKTTPCKVEGGQGRRYLPTPPSPPASRGRRAAAPP